MPGARYSVYRSLQTGSRVWPENPDPHPLEARALLDWRPREDRRQSSNHIFSDGEDVRKGGNYVEMNCRHDSLRIYVYGVGNQGEWLWC